jgi:hypothetical protein
MLASSAGKREYGDKERWVKYWARWGLLDFTLLRPVLAWRAFWNLWTVYLFNFQFFFSGYGKPRLLNQWIWGHDYTGFICKYFRSTTCKSLWLWRSVLLTAWTSPQTGYWAVLQTTQLLRIQTANKENATWYQHTFLNYTPDGHKISCLNSLSFTSAERVKFVCWI